MSLPAKRDRHLVALLRAYPRPLHLTGADVRDTLVRAESHGVVGVVHEMLRAAGADIEPDLAMNLALREAAREMDHSAHLAMLHRIDDALAAAGLRAVVLKGALLARRLYPRPSMRGTSDIDLLVAERDLEATARVLGDVGYSGFDDESERRFRREHHHLHFVHPSAPPLELHFHAYRGFGAVLWSEPLVSRSVRLEGGMRAVGVLRPDDELVYLAVHAAAHRFMRLGWLFDMKLLLATMTPVDICSAGARARSWGFGRAVAFAARLLVELLGVDRDLLAPLGRLDLVRRPFVSELVAEPAGSLQRSATRFAYTAALCDSLPAAARYAVSAIRAYTRRTLRVE